MPDLVDIIMPPSEETTEATVVAWLKQPGEPVEAHEPVLEISTDKVTMEISAPVAGVLAETLVAANAVIAPGELLGHIRTGDVIKSAESVSPKTAPPETVPPPAPKSVEGRRRLSPLVKRMLAEHRLSPDQITGSGRGGRITHRDMLAFLERSPAAMPSAGGSRMIPHTPMRRRIADHMVESLLHTAPHVTAVFDADFAAIVDHRAAHKPDFAERGVKLTYTAYLVQAAVAAIHEVPEVNSRWHDDALEVFDDIHLGIATALGRGGLMVPVVHQAQTLDLFGIASKLQDLTERARSGRLLPEDVRGGTFTLTNHGVSGSLIATPIINQPQSAILGVGKMEKRIVVVEEKGRESIQISPRAYITLTIDHRALDGFAANTFLSTFVNALMNPA